MKKFFVIAAAAAMTLSSCMKEGADNQLPEGTANLSVSINTGELTRTVEDSGNLTGLVVDNTLKGHIFIADASGVVKKSTELLAAKTVGAVQQIAGVQVGWEVYIVANVPVADYSTLSGLTNLNLVKAYTSALSTQSNYKKVALANAAVYNVAAPVGTATTVSADISLCPLISRIELAEIEAVAEAGTTVSSFKVAGVYLDDYATEFTYGGSKGAVLPSMNTADPDANSYAGAKDVAGWESDGVIAKAATSSNPNHVWAYNVAAGSLPRFIIKLTDIYTKTGGATPVKVTNNNGIRFLTVNAYKEGANVISALERGYIYRVSKISFKQEAMSIVPNPVDVDFDVKVNITQWKEKTVSPELN